MNRNKFYVTTPIYYVNSRPHLGTLYTTVIADVMARWNKILGKKVFMLTGTDEHGQKIQEKAQEMGKNPRSFVDSMIPEFKKVFDMYGIEYDRFIRTTDSDHESAVISWIKKLQDQGDIYKSVYSGQYCVPCETFVGVSTDPTKSATENNTCPSCHRPLREMEEESYFFRLSAYEQQLLNFYEQHPDFITPKERANEVISFVRSGLRDLSISRKTVSWGIPFPGDPEHTVYVWGDALNNYISAIGYGKQDKESKESLDFWWPADMHIMAKDIVRFHAVYWPAFLFAVGMQPPNHLLVHGYILVGDQKMSKSLGNAIAPDELARTFGPEQVRYYLLRNFPITQDGQFDIHNLGEHVTADLANNLGNLLSRTIALALNNNLTSVQPPTELEGATIILREKCIETYRLYWEEMNKGSFHIALAGLWRYLSSVNAYIQELQPWTLCKSNKNLFHEVIYTACHSLYTAGILLWPVMPKKMELLLAALGYTIKKNFDYNQELRNNEFTKTYTLARLNEPLFARPAQTEAPLLENIKTNTSTSQAPPTITINDFASMQLLVGTVIACEPVVGSKKLYKLLVDLGAHGKRQILSGIAEHFKAEQLIGKQGVFIANLAPRKIMGHESQGMMLFADNGKGKMHMVTTDGPTENGVQVF
jgi:methionyl-tRNA synthetase